MDTASNLYDATVSGIWTWGSADDDTIPADSANGFTPCSPSAITAEFGIDFNECLNGTDFVRGLLTKNIENYNSWDLLYRYIQPGQLKPWHYQLLHRFTGRIYRNEKAGALSSTPVSSTVVVDASTHALFGRSSSC